MADITIINNPQSTLSWAWSAEKPLIFIDSIHNPLFHDVARDFKKVLFYYHEADPHWKRKVIELLNLPYWMIMRMWRRMK